eukprot:gene2588-3658_t
MKLRQALTVADLRTIACAKLPRSVFGYVDGGAHDERSPSPEELALMEPYRKDIPATAFGPMTVPPRTDGDSSLRANLRRAQALLKQAGWEVRDGALRNAKGEAM